MPLMRRFGEDGKQLMQFVSEYNRSIRYDAMIATEGTGKECELRAVIED